MCHSVALACPEFATSGFRSDKFAPLRAKTSRGAEESCHFADRNPADTAHRIRRIRAIVRSENALVEFAERRIRGQGLDFKYIKCRRMDDA